MPPKKKGAKGKGGGPGNIVDGVDTSQMSREQLEIFTHRIREENEREREERNYFQIERDKLRNFWEITRNELEEVRAKLRNKDRQIEEENERNEEEVKFHKQKVKHLQYEHENDVTECKAESMVSLKLARDEHVAQERELLRDKQELKRQLREQETSHQDQIKALKLRHSEEMSEALREFERKSEEIRLKYEKTFLRSKRELETKHEMELSEIEERKNCQISALIKNHERSFNETKNYYDDITLNNLALISSLKDELEVLKKQEGEMARQVSDLAAEKKRIAEPLKKAQVDAIDYKKQLQNYKQDKLSLENTKAKLQDTKRELEELRWYNEALEVRFENLQADRNELHKKFVKAVLEVQQKTNLKSALLQRKIRTLNDAAEYREAVIGELAATSEIPPQKVNKRLEEMLHSKNMTIKDLQYELARTSRAHDDLLRICEEKLEKYGIPKSELNFATWRVLPASSAGRESSKGAISKS